MDSAFGVDHIAKAKKSAYRELHLAIRPATGKERKRERIGNSVTGGLLGGISGGYAGAHHSELATLAGAAGGAGIGAGLGAALPTHKHRAEFITKSAFGVDHSEVDKAFGNFRAARQFNRYKKVVAAERSAKNAARGKAIRTTVIRATNTVKDTPAKAKRAAEVRVSLGDIGRGVGGAVTRTGEMTGKVLSYKPGVTGAAAVGGAGYGAYKYGQKKPKSPRVY